MTEPFTHLSTVILQLTDTVQLLFCCMNIQMFFTFDVAFVVCWMLIYIFYIIVMNTYIHKAVQLHWFLLSCWDSISRNPGRGCLFVNQWHYKQRTHRGPEWHRYDNSSAMVLIHIQTIWPCVSLTSCIYFSERSLSLSDTDLSSPELTGSYDLHGLSEEDHMTEVKEEEFLENGQEVRKWICRLIFVMIFSFSSYRWTDGWMDKWTDGWMDAWDARARGAGEQVKESALGWERSG